MNELYSRQQAIETAQSNSNRLKYLETAGLVIPTKIGEGQDRKPIVLYNLDQIEQIKLINAAAEFLHLEGLRRAIEANQLEAIVEILSAIAALPEPEKDGVEIDG